MSMTERLFRTPRKPKGITLAEWPEKPCAEAMAPAELVLEPGVMPAQLLYPLLSPTSHFPDLTKAWAEGRYPQRQLTASTAAAVR